MLKQVNQWIGMTKNSSIQAPIYCVDDFHSFLMSNECNEASHVFVPNYTFKSELLRLSAKLNDSIIPPKVISMDTICLEEDSLFDLLDEPLQFQTVDPNFAEALVSEISGNNRKLSASRVVEILEETDVERVYNPEFSSRKFGIGNGYKFIEFLRKNSLYLLNHANLLLCKALKETYKEKIFIFEKLEPCPITDILKRKFATQLVLYSEKPATISVFSPFKIKTYYETDYDCIEHTICSKILNNEQNIIFIANNAKLINNIKTKYLSPEHLAIVKDNVDFIKVLNLLYSYSHNPKFSTLLKILKIEALDFSKNNVLDIELILRNKNSNNTSFDVFTSLSKEFELMEFVSEIKPLKNFDKLFSTVKKLFRKFAKDSLYLEYSLDRSIKTSKTLANTLLTPILLAKIIRYLINQVSSDVIKEFSQLKNLIHVKDIRYKDVKNGCLLNFNTDFFNDLNQQTYEEILLLRSILKRVPNLFAINTKNYHGTVFNGHSLNTKINSIKSIRHRTTNHLAMLRAPNIAIQNLKNVKLSPTSIKTLIANPYVFYLKYILKFREAEDIDKLLDRKNFGIIVHKCLENISFKQSQQDFILNFIDAFNAIANKNLHLSRHINALRIKLIASKIYELLKPYLNFTSHRETTGSISLKNVKIHATADLIMQDRNIIYLIDYKTGTPPTKTDTNNGKEPQLGIEKLLLEMGGFSDIGYAKDVEVLILNTSNTSKGFEKYKISSETTKSGLEKVDSIFFGANSEFFAKNDLQDDFNERNFYGILRKEEWVDYK